MKILKVYDLLRKRALITRQSASAIRDALSAAVASKDKEVALDFSGVDAVTPSFVDETLSILAKTLNAWGDHRFRVVFVNSPTRLSTKFSAVARARGMEISENVDGSWAFTGVSL